jgi:hypothetical protein
MRTELSKLPDRYRMVSTVRSESRCALRLRYVDQVFVSTLVDITSNTFYKCTVTFRTHICRTELEIKLNGFRPVYTLVDITSNTFYKCTATFRTHCITRKNFLYNFQFLSSNIFDKICLVSWLPETNIRLILRFNTSTYRNYCSRIKLIILLLMINYY